jgi:AAA15 family ATPase/GTPase
MLHYVSFRNFCSFREGATLSFQLDRKVPAGISSKKGIATVLAIKGANASGKTHALKVLPFLASFCARSFDQEPESRIPLSSFFDNQDPSEFEVEFTQKGMLYVYRLICTDKRVISETIFRRTNARKTKIIERKDNEIKFATKEFAEIAKIKIRSNASLIATSHQYEIAAIKPIRDFFSRTLANVAFAGFKEKFATLEFTAKYLNEHQELLAPISKFISDCDTGISKIDIHKGKNNKGEDAFFPIFWHEWEGKEKPITEFEESSGTKYLVTLLPQVFLTLKAGAILVLDELDMHMHPLLVRKIISQFTDPETNPHHAQLLCSTHDSDVLDQLGKYRVYLVNKHDNESFLYRLDEVPGEMIRNDRSIIPLYKDGKIGGVPRV